MANLAYDQMRQCNLGENKRILQQLGVSFPRSGSRVVLDQRAPRSKQRPNPKPKPQPKKVDLPLEEGSSGPRLRSSFRVQLRQGHEIADDYFKELKYDEEEDDDDYDEDKRYRRPKPYIKKVPRVPMPNSYGSIPGVEVGRWWETRMECNGDGVHRPTVAGIHGGPDGAYSLALSGGYEDDVDVGEFFTYTGEGGRDLKGTASQPKNLRTAPQSKDQVLERGNLALARSVETGNPVRVIRGYKLNSEYAPESGYRYDGLYTVKKYWQAVGKSGFKVYKFALVRCDPEPVPWKMLGSTSELNSKESHNSENEEDESPSTVSPTADPSPDLPDENSPQLTPQNKRKTRMMKQAEDKKQNGEKTVMFMETEDGSFSPVKCNTPTEIQQCLVKLCDVNTNSPPKLKPSPPPVVMHGCVGWEEDSSLQSNAVRFHLSIKNCDGPGTFVRFVNDQWIEERKEDEVTVNCVGKSQSEQPTNNIAFASPSSEDLKENSIGAERKGLEDDSEDLDWRWLKEDYEQDWKGWSRVEPIPVPKFQFHLVE